MTRLYGSPSDWQRIKTNDWIQKLVAKESQKIIILEGQMNPNFIRTSFETMNFTNYEIILLDCKDEELIRRLIEDRKQPELANKDMLNWLNYLRTQSDKYNYEIVDTTNRTIKQVAQVIVSKINSTLLLLLFTFLLHSCCVDKRPEINPSAKQFYEQNIEMIRDSIHKRIF